MMKKMKENKGKGFTLVELIVVLVILAILAALLIPALTGYIDRAKEKSIIAETRQAVTAAQAIADEKYGIIDDLEATGIQFNDNATEDSVIDGQTVKKVLIAEKTIKDLAEVDGDIIDMYVTSGKVSLLIYQKSGMKCTYDSTKTGTDGAYNVEKSK